jgi:hypothetical protein
MRSSEGLSQLEVSLLANSISWDAGVANHSVATSMRRQQRPSKHLVRYVTASAVSGPLGRGRSVHDSGEVGKNRNVAERVVTLMTPKAIDALLNVSGELCAICTW